MAKSNVPAVIPPSQPPVARGDNLPAMALPPQPPAVRVENLPAIVTPGREPTTPPAEAPSVAPKEATEPYAKIGAGMLGSWLRLGGQELGNLFTHQLPFAGNDPGHPFNATPQQVYEARQPQAPDPPSVERSDSAAAVESKASSFDARLKSFITGKDRGVHGPELEKSVDREGPERE